MQAEDATSGGDTTAVAGSSGGPLRAVLAEAFDLAPGGVERYLRRGDQVDEPNRAADAVEESPEFGKRDDYGRVVFRNAAYRYRLTSKAAEMAVA